MGPCRLYMEDIKCLIKCTLRIGCNDGDDGSVKEVRQTCANGAAKWSGRGKPAGLSCAPVVVSCEAVFKLQFDSVVNYEDPNVIAGELYCIPLPLLALTALCQEGAPFALDLLFVLNGFLELHEEDRPTHLSFRSAIDRHRCDAGRPSQRPVTARLVRDWECQRRKDALQAPE